MEWLAFIKAQKSTLLVMDGQFTQNVNDEFLITTDNEKKKWKVGFVTDYFIFQL